MSFKGKTVLVTGASSGIGAGIAIAFAKEGANVAIIGRNEGKLKNVVAKCEEHGSSPLVLKKDVTKEVDAKVAVYNTVDKFGGIDILVNNAGIVRLAGILSENIMEAYDDVMNTNMRAVVHLTSLAAPHIIKTQGNIINISSIGGRSVPQQPPYMPYCVSKAAMDHFTRCIAAELAPKGVRVNVVNPGPVMTDIAENSGVPPELFWKAMKEGTALKRVSEVEEIADLVLFLASEKAKGITGSSFVSDNGMLLNRG